jgi:hypothetical protein
MVAAALLASVGALLAGCTNDVDSSALFGSKTVAEAPPGALTPVADPAGRPAQVAFISACAEAYGFAHDAGKLKATYLKHEASRAGTHSAHLAEVEREYDATYRSITALSSSRKSSYCSTKDGQVVSAELRRYQSGFFEPTSARP